MLTCLLSDSGSPLPGATLLLEGSSISLMYFQVPPWARGVPPGLMAWGQSQPSSWRRWDCVESVAAQGGGPAPGVG